MKKFAIYLVCIFLSVGLNAQVQNLSGHVFNSESKPVEYATVALLQPQDSTLAFFAITDAEGAFSIKSVKAGTYRLQISFIGFDTYDTLLTTPLPNTNLGVYILQTAAIGLDAVQVTAERIPIQILGDTLQYNANSFKTAPDASAEELLKKLPGVEVDASGNIKAQGEDVQQVLVDGKEFFSSDPTVATKNLPADAIEKVQVYDKTSDDADFTGVDDGQRSKTINLVLKDGKKSMWLGNAQAGYGTDDRYQTSAKLYRFTKTNQIAALGMLNNVNDFGFSINDYIDFSGGIGNMMRSGGFQISSDNDVPVNFGQSVDGKITSGAAGLNYTYEPDEDHRFNVSYLGNGYLRNLTQNTRTEQFSELGNFETIDSLNEETEKYFNRINFNIRTKPDTLRSFIVTGNASMNMGDVTSSGFSANMFEDSLTNTLNNAAYSQNNNFSGTAAASYIRKTNTKWKYFKVKANGSGGTSLNEENWNNLTAYFADGLTIADNSA
ncbi:MAG TPA: carboxypeptidase regulatory-like domain-containing protein, partial [Chitinophagales bacterium]|nr:carboxypeptidase regulatory-like domain-containing protein [Chitinophagales bacterium]